MMLVIIAFLLFISMVILAIFSEIEKMRRALDRFCSFVYRHGWDDEDDSDKED